MRTLLQIWIVGLALFAGLAGCQGERGAGNLSAPEPNLKEQDNRNASGILSEDTSGSAIDRPQYSQDTVVIVAIGDSITYGYGAWDGGYPKRLESYLLAAGHNVVVLNKGEPGDQSAITDARFLASIVGADIVLLLVGVNDVINPGECVEPFNCQVVGHTLSMMDKALVSKIIPVVSTITPAQIGDEYDWANPQIQLVNAEIVSNAAQRGVVTVDNYQAVMNNGGVGLYYDRLHFNAWGYDVIAQQWYAAIEQNQLIQQALRQKKN
ncbi:MAG: SGNH/GDSL hydrolase family protein [bacterium]|nr:SGNH/GDSL hydrolase family protein [bacterium]